MQMKDGDCIGFGTLENNQRWVVMDTMRGIYFGDYDNKLSINFL